MAKVVITIDTDERNDSKEVIVHASIDGEDIPNMHEVHIHKFCDITDITLVTEEPMDNDLFVKRISFNAFAKKVLEEAGVKIDIKQQITTANLVEILEKRGKKHWTRS